MPTFDVIRFFFLIIIYSLSYNVLFLIISRTEEQNEAFAPPSLDLINKHLTGIHLLYFDLIFFCAPQVKFLREAMSVWL